MTSRTIVRPSLLVALAMLGACADHQVLSPGLAGPREPRFNAIVGQPDVAPQYVPGASNTSCAALADAGLLPALPAGSTYNEFKVTSGGGYNGSYTQGSLGVTITNWAQVGSGDAAYFQFDWSTTGFQPVAVFVKTGVAGANLYRYAPDHLTSSDDKLVTPGKNAISHVSFCYADGGGQVAGILAIRKTVQTAYTKSWTWQIAKTVKQGATSIDGSVVELTPPFPKSVVARYAVALTPSGPTISGISISGVITVENTGTQPAQVLSIADVLSDNLGSPSVSTCRLYASLDDAAPVAATTAATVAPGGGRLECDYSIAIAGSTLPVAGGPSLSNTATAGLTGTPATISTTQAFSFSNATVTEVDRCVDVADVYSANGIAETPTTRTVCAGDASPQLSYEKTISIDAASCNTSRVYANTATYTAASGATGSASTSYGVRVRCQGCTPGFWKNNTAAWTPTGLAVGTLLNAVPAFGAAPLDAQTVAGIFDFNLGTTKQGASTAIGAQSLLKALDFQGGDDLSGKAQILLRAGTAALLNASWTQAPKSFLYPIDKSRVQSLVNAALASRNLTTIVATAATLDGYNNLGCPLNAKGAWIGTN